MRNPMSDAIVRRRFLEQAGGAVLALPLAALVEACASLVTRTVPTVEGKLRLSLAHYPELAEAGGSLRVKPDDGDQSVYVLALGGDRFAALSPICPHRGCVVEIADARLVCPCHGSTYDREGQVVRGPAQRPLTRYPADLTSDGVLDIDLGGRS
jgi:Rieske Fe-S protein